MDILRACGDDREDSVETLLVGSQIDLRISEALGVKAEMGIIMYSHTMDFSRRRNRTGVIKMGVYSEGSLGVIKTLSRYFQFSKGVSTTIIIVDSIL